MHRQMTARLVGALFITATAAGVVSAVLLADQGAPDLQGSAAIEDRIRLGALAVVVMAAAIAMIPAMIFPVLSERSEALALGYVVARTVEVILLLPAAVGPLLLVTLGAHAQAGTLRSLVLAYDEWGHPVGAVFFCLGAAILNCLLYRSRLVPRLISGWGLLAVVPYLADAVLVMLGRLTTSSGPHAALIVPLALNEMVLAIWLLARGFAPSVGAVAAYSDGSVRSK